MAIPIIDPTLTGINIKIAIKESGYKIKDIVDIIGLSDKSTLYKYMRGDIIPSIDMLIALATITNSSIDKLIGTKIIAA